MSTLVSRVLGLGLMVALWAGPVSEARAACSEQGRAQAGRIGDQGLAKAKGRQWKSALTLLHQAIAVAGKHGCGVSRTAARLHALLGVVHLLGLRDRNGALAAWRRGLSIWSAVPLPKSYRWPGVVRLYKTVPRVAVAAPPPEPARARRRPRPVVAPVAPVAPAAPGVRSPSVAHVPRPAPHRAVPRAAAQPPRTVRRAPPPVATVPRLPQPRPDHGLPRLPPPQSNDSPPLARRRLMPSETMPMDASLYGLGSRLAWIRYRRAKRRRAWGNVLLWTGILGQLGFGAGGMALLINQNNQRAINGGWTLVGMAGLCHVLMWVGIGLRSGVDPTKAGLLLFTTQRVSSARIIPTPTGVVLTGDF